MPQLMMKPLAFFKPDPNQPRKWFDENDLRRLGESLRNKQLQPVLTQPDGTLIAGERRYRAALLVGLTTLEAKVADDPLNASQIKVWQLTENMHRADLTGHEKWQACVELMALNPQWQMKDLAAHLHLDPSMVTRLLSPGKCIEAAQIALRDGKIGISTCYTLAKCETPDEQTQMLAAALSGVGRAALEEAGRKRWTGSSAAVKVNKVKCVLPSGVQIVVSGDGVTLDESIEALGEAIKEMKRARELGYTAKTFAAAMKDKAKKK